MNTQPPPVIAAFFRAHNSGETDDFERLFTHNALVSDEHHKYRGSAIKSWIDEAFAKYQPRAETTAIAQAGDTTIVTAQVSGTFPGSPTEIRYRFTLKDGRIAALEIG
jgi:hypothetical protein